MFTAWLCASVVIWCRLSVTSHILQGTSVTSLPLLSLNVRICICDKDLYRCKWLDRTGTAFYKCKCQFRRWEWCDIAAVWRCSVFSWHLVWNVKMKLIATKCCQGRSDGGYIGIYTPPPKKKSVYLTNFVSSLLAVLFTCRTLTCTDFEIGVTS